MMVTIVDYPGILNDYSLWFFLSERLVSGKTLLAVGTGVAAVVATPVVLAGAGFTATGVAAGSLAAMFQVLYRLDDIEYMVVFIFFFFTIIERLLLNKIISIMTWSITVGWSNWIKLSPKGFIIDLITSDHIDYLIWNYIFKEWFLISSTCLNRYWYLV